MASDPSGTLHRLIGVYRADGGIRGELAYVFGKVRGTAHCALCDVTHSPVRRKRAWDAMVTRLGVPFDLLHLNERSAHVVAASGDRSPVVLASVLESGAPLPRLVLVMSEDDIEASDGSVERFELSLQAALVRLELTLPVDSRALGR
jgi:hypothetical protein